MKMRENNGRHYTLRKLVLLIFRATNMMVQLMCEFLVHFAVLAVLRSVCEQENMGISTSAVAVTPSICHVHLYITLTVRT